MKYRGGGNYRGQANAIPDRSLCAMLEWMQRWRLQDKGKEYMYSSCLRPGWERRHPADWPTFPAPLAVAAWDSPSPRTG